MKVVRTIKAVREAVREWRNQGLSVGFVPTMGYLHEGHQSLIKKAFEENDRVVVSIFVNPIQFGENEDLTSYPRNLESDSKLCKETGASLIFAPSDNEMYDEDFCTYIDMSILPAELCGLSRPVHFRGVMTVVTKLFNIVTPDKAYFGQKDAQQLAIIKQMVKDLSMNIEIVGCPIIREADGLAKSSRNTYLNKDERKAALVLSRAIFRGQELAGSGEKYAEGLISEMTQIINDEPLAKIDYVKAVDARTMQQVKTLENPVLVAMAVYIGKTRLIDNFTTV